MWWPGQATKLSSVNAFFLCVWEYSPCVMKIGCFHVDLCDLWFLLTFLTFVSCKTCTKWIGSSEQSMPELFVAYHIANLVKTNWLEYGSPTFKLAEIITQGYSWFRAQTLPRPPLIFLNNNPHNHITYLWFDFCFQNRLNQWCVYHHNFPRYLPSHIAWKVILLIALSWVLYHEISVIFFGEGPSPPRQYQGG